MAVAEYSLENSQVSMIREVLSACECRVDDANYVFSLFNLIF